MEWMTRLGPRISDRRLGDIVIPGTYNSAAYCRTSPPGGFKTGFKLYSNVQVLPVTAGSCYHDGDLSEQLAAGYRYFHLQVAASRRRTLVWAGGTSFEDIRVGLAQIRYFATSHPKEIIILHFHRMSIFSSNYHSEEALHIFMQEKRRQLFEMLVIYFQTLLVPASLALKPTLAQLWSTGHNIIVIVKDDPELVAMNPVWFWNDTKRSVVKEFMEEAFNPSVMFASRSVTLRSLQHAPRRELTVVATAISQSTWGVASRYIQRPYLHLFAVTMGIVFAIMISQNVPSGRNCERVRWCRSRPTNRKRKKRVFVFIVFSATTVVSYILLGKLLQCIGFQAVESNLLALSRTANLRGMLALGGNSREDLPLSPIVASCGVNSMLNFWFSRPATYKLNIVAVADFKSSSLPVDAINFNLGLLPRKVSLSHSGSPLTGVPVGWRFSSCPSVQVAYLVVSRDEGRIVKWAEVFEGHSVTWTEGDYPMDTHVIICVGGTLGTWFQLYSGNLQQWLDIGHDFYVRGTESRAGRGTAYISHVADHVTSSCRHVVPPGVLNSTQWDCSTTPVSRQRETPALHPGVVRHGK